MVIRISGYQYKTLKSIRLSGGACLPVGRDIRLSESQAKQKSSLMP
jgi:hypothetical protein